jgi:hypothetical protein
LIVGRWGEFSELVASLEKPYFLELRGEVRRIPLPRTPLNKGVIQKPSSNVE